MELIIGIIGFFCGVVTALIVMVVLLYWITKLSIDEDDCPGGYDYDFRRPNDGCEGYDMSNCCGSPIEFTDICSRCGEHCVNWCYECDDVCDDFTDM